MEVSERTVTGVCLREWEEGEVAPGRERRGRPRQLNAFNLMVRVVLTHTRAQSC